ncbi:MAG: hypothetical protein HY928_02470 [Elusimicrobia bacterium]|nr:hypothetical protein [Elusimicrobiota bacterium]
MPLVKAILLAAQCASACAVCFGADDKNVVNAFYIGGVILIAMTFILLGGLAYAVHRMERSRLSEDRRLGLLDGAS